MQNIKFDFLENKISATGVYVLSSILRTSHNFIKGFFSKYRGILKLKNNAIILRKNGSFTNKTCCQKQAFTFVFGTSQINKQTQISSIFFYINCSK